MTTAEIQKTLVEMVAKEHGMKPEEISLDENLQEKLGMDSLDVVEMSMAVEDRFKIMITDEDLEKLKTLRDMVQLVESKLAEKAA